MKIRVAGRIFDSEEIREISIREQQREVFVTTQEDFFRIKYRSEKEIEDVRYWNSLSTITTKQLHEALYTLIITCDYFINSKEQCTNCPLHKSNGCILFEIPQNWRNL